MCRMILLHGNLEDYVDPFFTALKEVSRRDPLKTEFNGDPYQHKDGWGYVSMSRTSEICARFPDPIFEAGDIHQASGLLVIHARRASVGESRGINFSHPFHTFDERYDYFLTHNGDFDKERILNQMGSDGGSEISDTQAFFRMYMEQDGSPREKLDSALRIMKDINAIKTVANIFMITKERTGANAECLIHSDSAVDKDYVPYYWLHRLESKGFVAVVSSSIIETEQIKGLADLRTSRIPQGEIVSMPVGNFTRPSQL